jgi:Ino eighty subunit 2
MNEDIESEDPSDEELEEGEDGVEEDGEGELDDEEEEEDEDDETSGSGTPGMGGTFYPSPFFLSLHVLPRLFFSIGQQQRHCVRFAPPLSPSYSLTVECQTTHSFPCFLLIGAKPRMTARQAVLASVVDSSHVALEGSSTRPKKQPLTEMEMALKREETARKRKNLSEKKAEDERVRILSPVVLSFFFHFLFHFHVPLARICEHFGLHFARMIC